MSKLNKIIFVLFAGLFFLVPLILWPTTSEVFEFNKIVLVYSLTTLIVSTWIIRSIYAQKIIFRRTLLDIPLLFFLGSQIISTIISIDPSTSLLGYYSRFNGGLFSTLCYSLLYWAFVSNMDEGKTNKLINFALLPSAALVCIYGVLEHFGIDKNVWVQDVASRVFSTLGQPNWLAAWVVALIPLTWANVVSNELSLPATKKLFKSIKFLIYFSLSILLFITLLFTKSRSGLLGFGVALVVFWSFYFWVNKNQIKKTLFAFGLITIPLFLISLISGTQFTPSISSLLSNQATKPQTTTTNGPALEVGGTESGTIRKIVWKGAIDVWKNYPIFGSGVETFAYSYYKFRPKEHNLVSEWDFIYNKAHNEFLNIAATSGSLGILSYLVLIGFSLFIFVEKLNLQFTIYNSQSVSNLKIKKNDNSLLTDNWQLVIALLAGYISLLVTNFFGFSVVPTQLQFFLFPAIAVALEYQSQRIEEYKNKKLGNLHKISILISCSLALTLLYFISRYWYADYAYNLGHTYNTTGRFESAVFYLTKAINLEPNQPIYHSELSNSYIPFALTYNQNKDQTNAQKYVDLAISEAKKAIDLSPANVNLKRSMFGVFIKLSTINSNFVASGGYLLLDAIKSAPTDAKLYYNLALVYARTGETDNALSTLEKTIDLKSNYKEARLAYAILLNERKQTAKAREQLEYILKMIDPNDTLTKQTLESIK